MDVLKIGDRMISVEELVAQVKLNGRDTVMRPLARRQTILACAKERELEVPAEALQKRFEDIRRSRGLYTMDDTERWMKENNHSMDDLEEEAELAELAGMLAASFDRMAVEKYFAENKSAMDAAEVGVITVAGREAADELAELLREGEEEFTALALEYSTDAYAKAGGYMGALRRADLPESLAAAVFGAKPGDTVGPVEVDGAFVVARLHSLLPAALDDVREQAIRRALLENLLRRNWIRAQWLI